MKTFKDLLIELNACEEAIQAAGNMTIEEAISTCHRGDWLLWLAAKIEIDEKKLSLAKGYCANTVRHLMRDERSIKAVDAAIAYGNGLIHKNELKLAADAAWDATASGAWAAASASAKKENQKQTADICRQYIGAEIIEKVNQIL